MFSGLLLSGEQAGRRKMLDPAVHKIASEHEPDSSIVLLPTAGAFDHVHVAMLPAVVIGYDKAKVFPQHHPAHNGYTVGTEWWQIT